MAWDQVMDQVLDLFVSLYPTQAAAAGIAQRAQVPARFINFNGTALDIWMSILDQASLRNQLQALIDKAAVDYPEIDFPALARRAEQPAPRGPKLDPNDWRGSTVEGETLEKIMGSQPTFLPIRFLEIGLERARAVVRVVCPAGFGSGFLIRDNLLITNNHVISSKEAAQQTRVQFNYQETSAGLAAPVAEFLVAPEDGFATSPAVGGDDWTAVRIKGNPNADWGALELAAATVKAQDFVNIIQHPSGLTKQIAMYHNLVAYADDRLVQYQTDTLPGSSGSPVFNMDWRVVAIHHSGGWLTEPASKRVVFRNEGIHINAVLRGLAASGLRATTTT
jgi:V8-like Glu-specific endopeptidase